jgi:UDP-N-acetylmuramoyl-tripeptide--D-alanyl-D-alanine ligase
LLTIAEILEATGGDLLRGDNGASVQSVSTDTRSLEPGALYVPLIGERFDGHAFVADAIGQGAVATLCSRPVEAPDGPAIIRVDDTLAAFGRLARFWRLRLGLTIIAVTGSTGKTSTKEAIADLLGRYAPTAKSHANFNNEVGVPLTLLGLRPGPWAAVLELAMRGPGEISYLAEISRPNVGVVTNVGTAHIGRLGSREAIAAAKGELVAALPDGRIVLNGDMALCRHLGKGHRRVRYFSTEGPEHGDVWAATDLEAEADGWSFRAMWRAGPDVPAGNALVRLPLPGRHLMANALAAIAVALHLGILLPADFKIAPAPVGGRSRLVAVGDIEVLDETYNANPESVRAALDSFCRLPAAGRRVVVLGDMAELGAFARAEHQAVGGHLDSLPLDLVVTIGEFAELVAATTVREAVHCRSNAEAVSLLGGVLRAGDRLLVKGSRAARLEEVIAGLAEVYA